MDEVYKKWLIGGVAVGVALAITLLGGYSIVGWYAARPRTTNHKALIAEKDNLWSTALDSDFKPAHFSISYNVKNMTAHDITLSTPPIIMERPESNSLMQVDIDHVDLPSIIPAGESVQLELSVPLFFNNEYVRGFVLFYPREHIAIDLPKPSGPTEEEGKKFLH